MALPLAATGKEQRIADNGPQTKPGIQMKRPSDKLIEITGDGWRLRYGTKPDFKAQLNTAVADRVYFSHGDWLRLIDAKKGAVVGRWHFPGEILRLLPLGNQVQVEVDLQWDPWDVSKVFRQTLTFNPSVPVVPDWPTISHKLPELPRLEAQLAMADLPYKIVRDLRVPDPNFKMGGDQAKKLIPDLQDAVRRDPCSPWFQTILGKLLWDVGAPQAGAVFHGAVRVPTTDFTELLPVSAFLSELGEHEAGRDAFERGYQDYLARGNDPRLLFHVHKRIQLYSAPLRKDLSVEHRREWIEGLYRIAPNSEGADLAWHMYAKYLEKQGQMEEARLWEARAKQTREFSWSALLPMFDRALLILLASILSAVIYALVLYVRYRPQRRLALAQRRAARMGRGFSFLNIGYWSPFQRLAFLTIALTGWLAIGNFLALFQVVARIWSTPTAFAGGKWAGPVLTWYLENGVKNPAIGGEETKDEIVAAYLKRPVQPERDLILAITYQQNGEKEKAERLYRALGNFSESWNNLGVILKEAGREQEARQAFEQALRIDPALEEAELNLGRAPHGLWAQLHQKYLPGRPMIAPPRTEILSRFILAGSMPQFYWRALGGPLRGALLLRVWWREAWPVAIAFILAALFFICALALAIALLFLIPSQEVTQSPGKMQRVWETLFPGTSPAWRFFGGVVLVAWSYLILRLVLLGDGVPIMLRGEYLPAHFTAVYGVPGDPKDAWRSINPSWVWVYAVPVFLFVTNVVLVFRDRLLRRG